MFLVIRPHTLAVSPGFHDRNLSRLLGSIRLVEIRPDGAAAEIRAVPPEAADNGHKAWERKAFPVPAEPWGDPAPPAGYDDLRALGFDRPMQAAAGNLLTLPLRGGPVPCPFWLAAHPAGDEPHGDPGRGYTLYLASAAGLVLLHDRPTRAALEAAVALLARGA